ncbi:MAG: RIP metalloprotease RseP [Gallionellaceae bacterium]|nr:RIP metalloprotease RseP [Gallionellaceae bacterium]
MITLLAFLVAIAVLVVIHELGHYWVARWCGVKVLRFSVGFGKPLYIKKSARSGTEWVISAIPLGGYVKMLDEREGEVPPQEAEQAFNRRPVWQRMAIVVAGPVANLLLAIVLYWGLFMHGVPGIKPVLGDIPPQTPAAMAHFQPQETLVSVAGKATPSWQEVNWAMLDAVMQGGEVMMEGRTAQGESRTHTLDLSGLTPDDLDGDFLDKLGLTLYQPPIEPVIGKVLENSAAQRDGLREDDRIVTAHQQPITDWKELVKIIRGHPDRTLRMEVARAGVSAPIPLDVTPEAVDDGGAQVGRLGAAPKVDSRAFDVLLVEVRYPPLEALSRAAGKTWDTAVVSLKMLGRMVMGQASLKNLSGPITIADYAGQTAQMGAIAYLGFLALISISLGVLNLLPIPLLDGGHLLYHTIELLKGSPVSDRAWEIGQRVGIALLVTLMAFALYNDISRQILG